MGACMKQPFGGRGPEGLRLGKVHCRNMSVMMVKSHPMTLKSASTGKITCYLEMRSALIVAWLRAFNLWLLYYVLSHTHTRQAGPAPIRPSFSVAPSTSTVTCDGHGLPPCTKLGTSVAKSVGGLSQPVLYDRSDHCWRLIRPGWGRSFLFIPGQYTNNIT